MTSATSRTIFDNFGSIHSGGCQLERVDIGRLPEAGREILLAAPTGEGIRRHAGEAGNADRAEHRATVGECLQPAVKLVTPISSDRLVTSETEAESGSSLGHPETRGRSTTHRRWPHPGNNREARTAWHCLGHPPSHR